VINRSYNRITNEEEFIVYNPTPEPDVMQNIKMEVGIEDCLHIEFEYNKNSYHLKDCVLGKVFFNLVRIKIKHMELGIVRKETIGSGANAITESENLTKFEVMDGAPVKGE
jgi:vacuolar protein sorting-associated protein 26